MRVSGLSHKIILFFLLFFFGTLITLSLAPFKIWPLGILGVSFLLLSLSKRSIKESFLIGWVFGLGQFSTGTSWIYISIYKQSNTPFLISIALTILWCMFLSLFTACFTVSYQKLALQKPKYKYLNYLLLAPALWVLVDFIRSIIWTGFPWLYLGYAHSDTYFSSSITIGGIFLATFLNVYASGIMAYIFTQTYQRNLNIKVLKNISVLCIPLMISFSFSFYDFVTPHPTKQPLNVTVIQANIPQETKWNSSFQDEYLNKYQVLLEKNLKKDHLFVFPETALPAYIYQIEDYLHNIDKQLKNHQSTLLTGVVSSSPDYKNVYNSTLALGEISGIYHKQHLVPFGEYIPLKAIRGLIDFFNLPMSDFSSGEQGAFQFKWKDIIIAPFICYEIAYNSLVRRSSQTADILLTTSNDTWFGKSLAAPQHMQIAQSRALEHGRYLIRSTNNGITAIVNHKGAIVAKSPQFQTAILTKKIPILSGTTPFSKFGNWPIIMFCIFLAVFIQCLRIKYKL
jgi:apolipoprotein N-acyltransferase